MGIRRSTLLAAPRASEEPHQLALAQASETAVVHDLAPERLVDGVLELERDGAFAFIG
jgi:hypothetical protein